MPDFCRSNRDPGATYASIPITGFTWASRAFVLYYALQSVQAAWSAWRLGKRGRAALYAGAIALAVIVLVFAVPAQA